MVELLYATEELDAGKTGFSLFVGLLGAGIVIGNALGARGGPVDTMRRYYLAGLVLMGVALLGMSVAPNFGIACRAVRAVRRRQRPRDRLRAPADAASVPGARSAGRVWGLWVALLVGGVRGGVRRRGRA